MPSIQFEFHPLSPSSWKSILKQMGLLGIACILTTISGKLFNLRDTATVVSGAFSGSMVFRFLCLVGALLILLMYINRIRLFRSLAIKSILAYALIAIVSSVWSFTPVATLGKSFELIIGIFSIIVVASQKEGNEKLAAVFNIIIYIIFFQLAVSFAGYLFRLDGFSEKASGGLAAIVSLRMKSPFMSANGVGYNSALLLIVLFNSTHNFFEFTLKKFFYTLFLVITLILSTSRTSFGIVIFAVILIAFHKNRKLFYLIAVPFSVIVLMDFTSFIGELFGIIQGEQAKTVAMTLSGRTIMWQSAFDLARNHPWLGMGFGMGSRAMFYFSHFRVFNDMTSTVHNGFLEVLTGVGLIGFIPWCLAFCSGISQCIKNYNIKSQLDTVHFGIWPVFLGSTIMSVGLGGASNEIFLLFIIAIIMIDIKTYKNKTQYFRVTW